MNEATIINLKIFPKRPDPKCIEQHQVPVAIKSISVLLQNHAEWDLAMLRIVPHIDGIKFVKRLALESNVELSIVKQCLRQLLYYECITMIDIFQHSNIYTTTLKLATLSCQVELQKECIQYVQKKSFTLGEMLHDNTGNGKGTLLGTPPLHFSKLFALYCVLQPGLHVADFAMQYETSLVQIDLRRFFTFGLIHGFVKRIHRYPVVVSSSNSPNGSIKSSPIAHLMTGRYNTDEICAREMISYADLQQRMEKEEECYVIHK